MTIEVHEPNIRLTFILGTVVGIGIMTVAEILFVLYLLAGGMVGTYSTASLDSAQPLVTSPAQSLATPSSQTIAVPAATHIKGAQQNYTVTLVEYTDYECKFCKRFFPEVEQFTQDHANQVRLIIKQYPLVSLHPQAKAAAVAAECAAQQQQLFAYSNQLFNYQTNFSPDTFLAIAKQLSLNEAVFTPCLTSSIAAQQISQDSAEAQQLNIQSQPNLVVWYNDGKLELINGYVSREYLESLLKPYLK